MNRSFVFIAMAEPRLALTPSARFALSTLTDDERRSITSSELETLRSEMKVLNQVIAQETASEGRTAIATSTRRSGASADAATWTPGYSLPRPRSHALLLEAGGKRREDLRTTTAELQACTASGAQLHGRRTARPRSSSIMEARELEELANDLSCVRTLPKLKSGGFQRAGSVGFPDAPRPSRIAVRQRHEHTLW